MTRADDRRLQRLQIAKQLMNLSATYGEIAIAGGSEAATDAALAGIRVVLERARRAPPATGQRYEVRLRHDVERWAPNITVHTARWDVVDTVDTCSDGCPEVVATHDHQGDAQTDAEQRNAADPLAVA